MDFGIHPDFIYARDDWFAISAFKNYTGLVSSEDLKMNVHWVNPARWIKGGLCFRRNGDSTTATCTRAKFIPSYIRYRHFYGSEISGQFPWTVARPKSMETHYNISNISTELLQQTETELARLSKSNLSFVIGLLTAYCILRVYLFRVRLVQLLSDDNKSSKHIFKTYGTLMRLRRNLLCTLKQWSS